MSVLINATPQHIQPVGTKFADLTVIGEPVWLQSKGKAQSSRYFLLCQCECGVKKSIAVSSLVSGNTKSCGCRHSRITSKMMTTHGESGTRLYTVWAAMRNRCKDPKNKNYRYYGGRGVTVCESWLQFVTFRDWSVANGYKEGLSIDRLNNDLGYCPENCRWADIITQANNTRSNVRVKIFDEEKTIAEWARDPRCAVSYSTLAQRLQRYYWEPEKALTTLSGATRLQQQKHQGL